MAEKISVQIALEGGKEVERQLEGIGEAGQKAFEQITRSAEQVGGFKNLETGEVTKQLKGLGLEGTKAFDQIQAAVSKAVKFETLVTGVQSVETAFVALGRAAGPVGLAIAAGLTAAAKATISFAAEVGKIGEQVKFDQVTQAFKELQDAATRGFGAQGTQQLAALQKVAEGTGKAAEFARQKLVELGLVQAPDIARKFNEIQASIQGLSRVDAATKVQQALLAITDPAERAAVAVKLFGDAIGTKLAADLQKSGASADTFRTVFSNLITPEDVSKADALNQSITRLSDTWQRFGSLTLAPTLVQGIDLITNSIARLNTTLQTLDWSSFGLGARFALSPIGTMLELIQAQFQQTGQAGQQAGQQAAQGLQLVINPLTGMPELVNTATQALAQTGPTAQQAGQQGTSAMQSLSAAVDQTTSQIQNFITTVGSITWDAISSAGVAAWNAVTSAIDNAISKLLEWIGLKERAGGGGGGGGNVPGKARGGLIGGRGTGTSDSNLAWLSRGEHVMPAHVVRQPGMLSFLESLRRGGGIPGYAAGGTLGFIRGFQDIGGGGLADEIANWIVKLADVNNATMRALLDLSSSISDSLLRIGDRLSDALFAVTNDMNTLVRRLSGSMARGGLLGGRGTGTSDSNLAWVSRGEYITPARAVAQPGVLAFLEALRRSGGNLSAVLDGMNRFALGGLVPRYAGGGAVGSMSHVTINFPGTPPISGLRASAGVVEQLQRAAALAQVRSGGRKPSRYS